MGGQFRRHGAIGVRWAMRQTTPREPYQSTVVRLSTFLESWKALKALDSVRHNWLIIKLQAYRITYDFNRITYFLCDPTADRINAHKSDNIGHNSLRLLVASYTRQCYWSLHPCSSIFSRCPLWPDAPCQLPHLGSVVTPLHDANHNRFVSRR